MGQKENQVDSGFGLYLHWPFCQSKCPYCDFNSHVAAQIDYNRWQTAILSELDRTAAETSDRTLRSVFFGGGTPSLMPPALVHAIMDRIRKNWRLTNDPEVTLEANPSTVEASRFADYRQAGINRVSIGVQALNDDDLRRLGRMHSRTEALRAIEIAQGLFPRFSFDLIYARQGQTLAQWDQELRSALALGTRHMSLYQLTIEEGTVFHERHRKGQLRNLPDEDLSADLYALTQDLCDSAGLSAYETSNHARPGEESRHNLIYWQGGDYVGIGPGAHGRITIDRQRLMTECPKPPGLWLNMVENQGSGESPRVPIDPWDQGVEYLMMGLRLRDGLSRTRLEALLNRPIASHRLDILLDEGLIQYEADCLSTTAKGRPLLNAILGEILVGLGPRE